MVKYVLFSLSLLSMLIGLGDAGGPDSEICEFSIVHESLREPPQLALKCDSTVDNVVNMIKIIENCSDTVKFDVFLHESLVKARVSCLVEYLGFDIIVTQSSGPVVYDVFRFSFENKDRTSVISAKLLSDNEGGKDGLWMKTGGEVSIKLIASLRLLSGDLKTNEVFQDFKRRGGWKKSLAFQAKEAPRNQATLVMLHETGVIIAKPFDAEKKVIEAAIEDEGKKVEGFKLAILLLEGRTERLFEAEEAETDSEEKKDDSNDGGDFNKSPTPPRGDQKRKAVPNQPSFFIRRKKRFEGDYTNPRGLPRLLTKVKEVKNGKDSAGVARSSRRMSGFLC